MDSLTFVGLLFAFLAIFGGQILEGGSIESLLNFPAFVIVIGGTFGAALIQTNLKVLIRAFKMIRWCFISPIVDPERGIKKLVNWSLRARKAGLLGLEDYIDQEKNHFEQKGLTLLVDGGEPEKIRDTLLVDLEVGERESIKSVKFFEALGGYAPTMGIVGAVLGLIQVMGNLSDPSQLGSGIATAFVATIYGVGSANLLFLPIANKLTSIVLSQSLYREMIIEGIALIAEGENPKVIESRLFSFVPR
ncbi:flagellar motor protein [Pleionea mediterranea]|uniref:Chemotaxis protein MotA n=1 Tax=Pleionea mediterranea TaxID=523701 RepID=A0A316FN78_9GAMM|nr:flagellar motor protein [Pleionea mediterranea]PWK49126.1 chemotaxis protein MotA [Pleionea mediterranea]